MNLLNEKLKELRAEKKLTQKELANFLSVPIPTLSHWECGYAEPSCDDIINLCNFFNVSTDYLLGRTDDFGSVIASPTAPNLSEEDKKLLSAFHGLDRELQELLWDMIRTWQKNATAFSPQKHA